MSKHMPDSLRRLSASLRRSGGFTMVELIVVISLIGILSAIGVARFFDRTGYDATTFAEQSRAMLRYAQKLAVAQNRPVYVQGTADGVALCFNAAMPCPPADLVPAPSGANSGSAATRARCLVNGAYVPAWYCEGWPSGVTMQPQPGSGTLAAFFFNGLGQPGVTGGGAFAGLKVFIAGGGVSVPIEVSQETGYVN